MGEAIQAALQAHPAVESTSIAGPGFVNVVVSDSWLGERIDSMLTNCIGTWAPALAVGIRLLGLSLVMTCSTRYLLNLSAAIQS